MKIYFEGRAKIDKLDYPVKVGMLDEAHYVLRMYGEVKRNDDFGDAGIEEQAFGVYLTEEEYKKYEKILEESGSNELKVEGELELKVKS